MFVLLVMKGNVAIRRIGQIYDELEDANLLSSLSHSLAKNFAISFYHVEAVTLIPHADNCKTHEDDGDEMVYLKSMMDMIGVEIDKSKKYIVFFFRIVKDVVILTTNKSDAENTEPEVINS